MNGVAQQGFNIVELMIALTIVSLLAATALPTFVQDYTLRAKVSEGVMLAAALKMAIQETYQLSGPSDMSCRDVPTCSAIGATRIAATKNVLSVTSDASGIIQIQYQPSVLPNNANILAIAPAYPAGSPFNLQTGPAGIWFVWECGTSSAVPGVPGAGVAAGTNVPDKFLPHGCKP